MIKMKNYTCFLIVLISCLILVKAEILSDAAFSFEIGYDSGEVIIQDLVLIEKPSSLSKISDTGEYSLRLISFLGEDLYDNHFDFDLEFEIHQIPSSDWFDEQGNQIVIPVIDNELIQLNQTTKFIFVPYFSNAKTVELYKQNRLFLRADISEFAVCNQNKVCEEGESYEICSYDCKPSFKQRLVLIWQKITGFFKSIFKKNK